MRRGFFAALLLSVLFVVPEARGQEAPAVGEEGAGARMISLNLTGEVELRVFLDYIHRRTGRNFIYDEDFSGKVNLLAPTTIREDRLFSLLETLLEFKDYALVPTGRDLIKVVRKTEGRKRPTPFYMPDELDELPDTDTMVTLAYQVKHVGTNNVQTLVSNLLSDGSGAVVSLPQSKTLLIMDYASNLKRLVRVVRMLDSAEVVPQIKVFELEYSNAEQLARELDVIFKAQGSAIGADTAEQVTIEFDVATNSIIAVAPQEQIEKVGDLIAKLDTEPEEGGIRFYRLKNAKAQEVEATLQKVIQAEPSGVSRAPGARQRGGEAGGAAGLLGGADVRVIGDEGQNSIIVVGPPDIQSQIEDLIEELDKRKPQVLIEALVIQVTGGDDLDVGFELAHWAADRDDGGAAVTTFYFSEYDFETGTRTISAGRGLTGYIVNNEEIPILLRALLVRNDGKVISRPRILATTTPRPSSTASKGSPTRPSTQSPPPPPPPPTAARRRPAPS